MKDVLLGGLVSWMIVLSFFVAVACMKINKITSEMELQKTFNAEVLVAVGTQMKVNETILEGLQKIY